MSSEGHGQSCQQEEQSYIQCGTQEEGNQKQGIPLLELIAKNIYHDSSRNEQVIKQRSGSTSALETEYADLSIISCEKNQGGSAKNKVS